MRQSTHRRLVATAAALACVLAGGPVAATAPAQAAPELPALGQDFLWGVAASGFQSEGRAPDSNWTRFIAEGTVDPYRDSVRFLDRYAADIDRAARLGAKVFRISLEWARVQPAPDRWDDAELSIYDAIVNAILAAGMTPMLTLDHWVYPGWAAERGGWRHQGMVEDWLVNARKMVEHFASRDPIWVTINEPGAYLGTERRIGALTDEQWPEAMDRLAQAHNAIYDHIHEVQPKAWVTSNIGFVPGIETEVNQPFVDKVRDRLDFIGVDYYFGPDPGPQQGATAAGAAGMWHLPLQTEGIYYALRHYARQFPGKPLYVVENGMPTENNNPRPDGYTRADHLRDTIYWLQRAKADGMNVIGYNYWSITDNYEWGSYTPRFGLYTVNVVDDPELVRHPTDAVEAFATLARTGGVPATYHPTRPPVPCSQVDPPSSCDEPVEPIER
ncbi:family 1 glycosylhydrolase [Nocardia sp. CDC159]|uniref:Family 1 glycosylhydrolase n=1 Tax=Nocardia pulmonis TaxID=2951408 RepID=A0A9X2E2E5_9NOCA|nr:MULTISPECIES: family 1 glycosylhydrolase [Nocardia]MCM6772385.1 family 1 glycosylhydrolase [Nocardia pulmonis]MCM6784957.1 family 1 glycosylhydrolase [Nocardia sp. CDC159]